MGKPTRRAALARTTALSGKAAELPELETPAPAIGDNQPALPPIEVLDDQMRDVLALMANKEAEIENARQTLARFIILRQEVLRKRDPNILSLADLMEPGASIEYEEINRLSVRNSEEARARREARSTFAEELLTELCGPFIAHRDRKTDADHDRMAHRARVGTRLKRATDLAIALVWRGYGPDDFDMDKNKWRTQPTDYCPPGYDPAVDLLMGKADDKGKRTAREFIWLENAVEDSGNRYYVTAKGGHSVRISVSLDQFLHATERTYLDLLAQEAKVTPPASEPTAPAQAKADAAAKAEADKAAQAAASTPAAPTTPAPTTGDAPTVTQVPEGVSAQRAPRTPNAATQADAALAEAGEAVAVSVSTSETPETDTTDAKAKREHTLATLNKALPLIDDALNKDHMAGVKRTEFSKAALNTFETMLTIITRWNMEDQLAADAARKANGNGKRKAS